MSDYTTKFFYKGEVIFREGFSGDMAFLVKSGRVGISREVGNETLPLAEFGPGEIFGEMVLLLPAPRTATATMLEGGELIVIPKERFDSQLAHTPPMIRTAFQSLADRLNLTTDRLEPHHEHSTFLGVCRILEQSLESLKGQRVKVLPYRDAVKLVKDILGVSPHEAEAVFYKLQDLGLIVCHKDGIPSRSLVFVQHEGFYGACERYYQGHAEHFTDKQDDWVDMVDLLSKTGFDPDRLFQLGAQGLLPIGLMRVSKHALTHWAKTNPDVANEARVPGLDDMPLEGAASDSDARVAVD